MDSPIIVALDKLDKKTALALADKLKGLVWGFKVNDLFFEQGAQILRELKEFGNVMCDGKFHDIPNTAENSLEKLKEHADIFTVHATAGKAPVSAACATAPGKIAAVTVLTSLSEEECVAIYGVTPEVAVPKFANMACGWGATYMVSSGQELDRVSDIKLKKIVPGIRPAWHTKADDQKRVVTPAEAIQKGANLLVIGRPIVQAKDPAYAAQQTWDEIQGAVKNG